MTTPSHRLIKILSIRCIRFFPSRIWKFTRISGTQVCDQYLLDRPKNNFIYLHSPGLCSFLLVCACVRMRVCMRDDGCVQWASDPELSTTFLDAAHTPTPQPPPPPPTSIDWQSTLITDMRSTSVLGVHSLSCSLRHVFPPVKYVIHSMFTPRAT